MRCIVEMGERGRGKGRRKRRGRGRGRGNVDQKLDEPIGNGRRIST
jgi:hypothetical protein